MDGETEALIERYASEIDGYKVVEIHDDMVEISDGLVDIHALPLQIASGILIAVLVLAGMRFATSRWARNDRGTAAVAAVLCGGLGLALIVAGLGLANF